MDALGKVRQADADVEHGRCGGRARPPLPTAAPACARRGRRRGERAAARLRAALDLVSQAQPELKDEDRPLARRCASPRSAVSRCCEAAAELLPLQARAGAALRSAEAGWAYVVQRGGA